jgi:hypothetical protein
MVQKYVQLTTQFANVQKEEKFHFFLQNMLSRRHIRETKISIESTNKSKYRWTLSLSYSLYYNGDGELMSLRLKFPIIE